LLIAEGCFQVSDHHVEVTPALQPFINWMAEPEII
jgi:hypothetical protein